MGSIPPNTVEDAVANRCGTSWREADVLSACAIGSLEAADSADTEDSVSVPPPPQAARAIATASVAMTIAVREVMNVFIAKLLCPVGRNGLETMNLKGAFSLDIAFAKAKKRPELTFSIILLFLCFVKLKSAYFLIKTGDNQVISG